MAHSHIPFIQNNRLIVTPSYPATHSQEITVGSLEWYAWLQDETNRSFSFKTDYGTFSVRRELKRHDWYWYAYRKIRRAFHKIYLGRSQELTPERLRQVAATFVDELPDDKQVDASAEATQSRAQSSTAIPSQPDPLIGRESEVDELVALMRAPENRLVTLTGPGGIGKTRLGSQVVELLTKDFLDGAVFISLADVKSPHLVLSTMLLALRIEEKAERSPLDLLKATLHSQNLLLLLDNFEQIIEAAPQIAELLEFCPGLKMLVTSRAALHIKREREYPVSPLSLPDLEILPDVEELGTCASVMLFLRRCQAIKHGFTITPANVRAIAEICVQLDGLPLAIELATARIRVLRPQELLARLHNRLPMLTEGPQDAPTRQRTLRATIEWSYNLLSPYERQIFQRLAIFAGGCSLHAAETLCKQIDGQEYEIQILDAISSLIDQNLLTQTNLEQPEVRFRMLETIREFGLERLYEGIEAQPVQMLHAQYCLTLAEEIEPLLLGPHQALWTENLEQELANIRVALYWFLSQGEHGDGMEPALRLASALLRFWDMRGRRHEGWHLLERALASSSSTPVAIRVKALDAASMLAMNLNEQDRAMALSEEALRLCEQIDDRKGNARALLRLSKIHWSLGQYPQAKKCGEEARSLFEQIEDLTGIADSLENLSAVALDQGKYLQAQKLAHDCLILQQRLENKWGIAYALWLEGSSILFARENLDRARALLEESAHISREINHKGRLAYALITLGFVVFFQGELSRTCELFEESLSCAEKVKDRRAQALGYYGMGWLAMVQQQPQEAHEQYQQSLELLVTLKHHWITALCIEGLAATYTALEDRTRAAQFFGAAQQLRENIDAPLPEIMKQIYKSTFNQAREMADKQIFDSMLLQGRNLTPPQLLPMLQPVFHRSQVRPLHKAFPYTKKLTERESEILKLLVEDLNNNEIIEKLVIAQRTLDTHLHSIYRKLGVSSRNAAIAYAKKRPLH